ncbi:MAG TPA: ATP synthase subunit I [Firmicutes bacterium]|nr:ATP synthase subunit I [Bacillales bacterium]HJA39914.1 ATP synthase subunit I [Bacillota bacterium]
MNELQIRIKRLRKVMLILVILDFSGYFLTEYQAVFAGLLFGMAFGYLNIGFMARRVNQVAQEALLYEEGKNFRMPSSKPFFRLALAAIVIAVAFLQGTEINVIALIIGLMTHVVVIIIDVLLFQTN